MENIGLIVAIIIGFLNLLLLWLLNIKVNALRDKFKRSFLDLSLSSKISDIFANGIDNEDIHVLAGQLFDSVKQKYNIKAKSYSDAIREIRKVSNINEEFRDSLIDFFEEMISISYKQDFIAGQEEEEMKEQLKRKLRMILHSLQ